MMTLQQIAHWLPGAVLVGDAGVRVHRVHTDTRSLQPGDLFVALKGERFDAHDFLAQAVQQGAVAALAQHGLEQAGLPGLQVPDTKLALGQLAAAWRAQFALPLIAVTGSNGKTTVTQMLASVLQSWQGEHALATHGNLNNEIGVPLTLLRLRAHHAIGVVELGMNHPGEIAYLSGLVQPAVALVNNAQREHMEFMATVEAVAHENGTVIGALPPSGVAVFPADELHAPLWRKLAGAVRVVTFSLSDSTADVTCTSHWAGHAWHVVAKTPAGDVAFALHMAGRHNLQNALAATASAYAAGVPLAAIASGLNRFVPVAGRSCLLGLDHAGHALTLIDDSYNANPDSMQAAIEMLLDLPGPHLVVLGDMGEVGQQGPQFHADLGVYAHKKGIHTLLCTGALMQHTAQAFPGAEHHDNTASLLQAVHSALPRHASVLVKGSRFMKMEKVVQAVVAQHRPPPTADLPGHASRPVPTFKENACS